jgi:hypothetical protein
MVVHGVLAWFGSKWEQILESENGAFVWAIMRIGIYKKRAEVVGPAYQGSPVF